MAVLLVSACGVLTAATYYQVRQSVFAIASGRLAFAAHQIQSLLTTSLRTRVQTIQQIAARSDLRDYLAKPTAAGETGVRKLLAAVPPGNGRSAWRLADRSGATLFTTKDWTREPIDASTTAATLAQSAGVSRFLPTTDGRSGYYDIVTPVAAGDGSSIGWLVERRWMSTSAPNLPVLEGLIGSQARLFIGNVAGDFWTDFIRPIPALPGDVSSTLASYAHEQGQLLVRGSPVGGAPWVVAAGLPLDPVMAPVRRFLAGAVLVTVLVVAAGAIVAWRVSRRITVPLAAVTRAAESIAVDRESPDRTASGGDEITRLSSSFDAMAARVKDAQAAQQAMVGELESRVQARTAELENANRELQAFSYSVSHDLRAPVRAISSFVRILLEERGHELSDESRRYLEIVTRRTRQMGQLIDDLLALSQVGRRQVGREPIDMRRLFSDVADEVRATEPGRQVEFRLSEVPPAAGEAALVRQVLSNLIQNAFKFTRTRPVAEIEAGALGLDGEVAYYVRDNGVGFPMQYANRLFDPFQRLHASDDFEGTGIGLAIVQRVVAKHGGRVWAESVEGQGATFYFTLAARQLEAA